MTFDELYALVILEDSPSLCIDSRFVSEGAIFAAIRGTVYDGHDFISEALAGGAKYIVCEESASWPDAEVILVEDSSKAAAVLAQAGLGNPASQLINLAVTGTNGKTTIAYLVRSILKAAGQKCGLIGTIIYDTSQQSFPATLTTPDCLTIAQMQQKMVQAGAKYMAIEASSHALSQNRLAGIEFKAAAFTNLSGDHLDYHKTEADYLSAKMRLFEGLSRDATAVLNRQSPHAGEIAERTKAGILWYAVDEPADLTAHIETMDIGLTIFSLEYGGEKQKVTTSLVGRYNVCNCLAATGLCLAAGFDLQTIANGISALTGVPGRLEKVDNRAGFTVLIDYAHTDDALKNVLSALKPLCKGRLIVVFGCGGDRDNSKRPRMAKVAEELADEIIVTSDNPRTEQPEYIIGEIMTGFENPVAETIAHEINRKKAIALAINKARKDDIVLIAGKGHETYQIIGKEKFDFSDRDVAEQFLNELK
jgi:UDP-N-acetylmuramoyl-L-alanyl-D-glutamate--2,6-diaminopimelate ligase